MLRQKPPRTAPHERTVERLRALCLALPEAREKLSHGEPCWFAGKGKSFAMLDDHHDGAPHLAVWFAGSLDAQEALIASDPERFFKPPYVRGRLGGRGAGREAGVEDGRGAGQGGVPARSYGEARGGRGRKIDEVEARQKPSELSSLSAAPR